MTVTQLIINMASAGIWLFCLALLVDRLKNGKRPPSPED
jgi:hypothetical protein